VPPRFDLPSPDEETAPFWDGVNAQRLLVKRCNACAELHFYPRPFCPRCWSDDVEWFEVSGRARLYTWSVVYNNDLPPFHERLPYVAALVDLDEGPRMMTNVVDCPFDELAADMPLEVVYDPVSDDPPVRIPRFRPVRG
jgi:hypothetical protein